MSRCPLCGSKDCCGGYYQEVQDVLADALEKARTMIEKWVPDLDISHEYKDVVRAIQKARAIRKARGEE